MYLAQKEATTRGDIVKLVDQDMVELNMSYQQLEVTDKVTLNTYIHMQLSHFFFKSQVEKHKKVKDMHYEAFEFQPYLQSANLHYEEIKTLTAVKSICGGNLRVNFRKIFKGKIYCFHTLQQ